VIGYDGVAFHFAGRKQFEPTERKEPAIPVTPPEERRKSDESIAVTKQPNTQPAAVQVAEHTPPREKPVRRLRQFVAHRPFEEIMPFRAPRLGIVEVVDDLQRRGGVEGNGRENVRSHGVSDP